MGLRSLSPTFAAFVLLSACAHGRGRAPDAVRRMGSTVPACPFVDIAALTRLKRPIDGGERPVYRARWTDQKNSLSFLTTTPDACVANGFGSADDPPLPEGTFSPLFWPEEARGCRLWADSALVPVDQRFDGNVLFTVLHERSGFRAYTFDLDACVAQGLVRAE